MDRERLTALIKVKGSVEEEGQISLDIERDLSQECLYVDYVLSRSMNTGRCAKLLRNLMVIFQAGIPQRADGKDYLFDPQGVCETIRVLEGLENNDQTKGPFMYNKGPLQGLFKKHFFQSSFLINNILLEIEREGSAIIYRKFSQHYGNKETYMGKPFTENDAELVAEAFTKDAIERRASRRLRDADGGLTGEHLIYAKLPRGNIYLYASFHGENLVRISDCIRSCAQDYPELQGIAPVFMTR